MRKSAGRILLLGITLALSGTGKGSAQGGFTPKEAPRPLLRLPASRTQANGEDPDLNDTERAKSAYLDVAHISALSADEQARQVSYVYRDIEAQLSPLYTRMMIYCGGFSTPDRPDAGHETPEAFAARLAEKKNWIGLYSAAETGRAKLLAKHPDIVNKLVREDLHSRDIASKRRALNAVAESPQPALLNQVVVAYLDPNDATILMDATRALERMRGAGALDRLLPFADSDNVPSNYPELIGELAAGRPAPLQLLRTLETGDIPHRKRALTMLRSSGDPVLALPLARLLKDADPAIRNLAAMAAMPLTGQAFVQVRPALLALLRDPDRAVGLQVAMMLASKQDPAAGPVLLIALKDETLEQGSHSNVVQAMNTLAGSYFGYNLGDWKPATETNRTAIAKFAEWVAAHPANK